MILTEYDEQKYRAMEQKEWEKTGKEEGKLQMLQESIIKILKMRFQVVPESLNQKFLNESDLQKLNTWFDLAVTVSSMEEFIHKMK